MNNANIDLSKYTEIGTIVDIGPFKIRLLDTNYNNSGLKVWQTVDVIYPNEVKVETIDINRLCCFYNARGLMDALFHFERKLPKDIRKQLVTTLVPCYFPEEKNIKDITTSVFLLSATEMCQNIPWFPCEGRPLEYYIHNLPVINGFHWLRTPHRNIPDYWGCVSNASNVFECCITEKFGIVPAFCTK